MKHVRLAVLAICLAVFAFPATASAQINPFADADEEEKASEEKDEKADKPKKDSSKKKKSKEKSEDEEKEDGDGEAKADEVQGEDEKGDEEATAGENPETDEKPKGPEGSDESEKAEAEVEKPSPTVDRVALSENYGKLELITTGVVLPVGLGLAIGGPALFGEPGASMTSPQLGSLDYRMSISSHGDLREGSPFLFGVFDIGGIAYPSLLGGFYLLSGVYYWAADKPMLASQSVNIDHSMIGMAQTVGWTALTAGVVHTLIGRQRPFAAFGRDAYGDPDGSGANLSFFATTSALSFAMSSFAARDYAARARRNGANVVTGMILPYTVMYGISGLIGFSSIYGQQHYFSDVAIAGLTGMLIGNLAYVAHFDTQGNPRERHSSTDVGPTALTSPRGDSVSLGLGLTHSF